MLSTAGTLDTAILCNELISVRDWRSLGLNLGVRDYELDRIESSHPTEGCSRWMQETFSLWLRKTPSASWENVVKALRQMGENKVAAKIEQKYISRGKLRGGACFKYVYLTHRIYCMGVMFHKFLLIINRSTNFSHHLPR